MQCLFEDVASCADFYCICFFPFLCLSCLVLCGVFVVVCAAFDIIIILIIIYIQ